jgi:hypothetical protein
MTEAEVLAWKHGYLMACCNMNSMFDRPGMAADVLGQATITQVNVDAMDLCEFDIAELAKIRAGRKDDPII